MQLELLESNSLRVSFLISKAGLTLTCTMNLDFWNIRLSRLAKNTLAIISIYKALCFILVWFKVICYVF
nr:hypothetical protein Iba_chr10bCG6020 [Ipomoea batatas]